MRMNITEYAKLSHRETESEVLSWNKRNLFLQNQKYPMHWVQ